MLRSPASAYLSLGVAAIILLGAATPVRVPYATSVNVHVKNEVSSSRVQVGDKVPIEVASDVVVGGFIVFARGADGLAQVSSVTAATGNSVGQIQLTYKWVRSVDGSKIGVSGAQSAAGTASSSVSNTASAVNSAQNTANAADVSSTALDRVSNIFGRAREVSDNVNLHPKAGEGAIEPDRTIVLTVRNPDGVTISSSQKATPEDDLDVK